MPQTTKHLIFASLLTLLSLPTLIIAIPPVYSKKHAAHHAEEGPISEADIKSMLQILQPLTELWQSAGISPRSHTKIPPLALSTIIEWQRRSAEGPWPVAKTMAVLDAALERHAMEKRRSRPARPTLDLAAPAATSRGREKTPPTPQSATITPETTKLPHERSLKHQRSWSSMAVHGSDSSGEEADDESDQ